MSLFAYVVIMSSVNTRMGNDNEPLDRMNGLFVKLVGSKYFTVFDLKDTYLK